MNKKIKMLAVSAAMLVAGLSITSCGGTSDKEIAESAINRLPTATIPNQIQSTQLQLYSEMTVSVNNVAKKVNITYTATPAENFVFGEAQQDGKYYVEVKLPTETIDYTITATATFNKATATKVFKGKLLPNTDKPSETSTVAEALAATDGTIVTIKGVTANARSGKGFFVVDSTGAIFVFDKGVSEGKFQYGQTVTVTATRGKNNGQYSYSSAQLVYGNDSSLVVNGSGEAFPTAGAKETTIKEVKAWKTDKSEDHSGKFIKVRAKIAKYKNSHAGDGEYAWLWEALNDDGYIQFYASNSSVYEDEYADLVDKEADIYLAVYDLQPNKKWRFAPLYVKAVA